MLKKVVSLIIAIVMLVPLLAGCGGKTTENTQSLQSQKSAETTSAQAPETTKDPNAEPFKISVSSWHFNDDPSVDKNGKVKAYKEAAISLFKSKYANAEVVWNNTPSEKYFDILKAKLASNSADDVFYHQNTITLMGKSGFCSDLSDQPWAKDMLDLCKPYVSFGGKVIAAPGAIGGWGVWYNKKMFSDSGIELPKTWGEFIKVCEALKAKNITPIVCGFKDSWTATGFYDALAPALVFSSDKEFIINAVKGTKKLNSPEFQVVFTKFQELVDKGFVNKNALSIGWDQSRAEFGTGNAAIIFQGSWMPSVMSGEYKDFDLGFMAIPDDNGNILMTSTVGDVVSVNSGSKLLNQGKDFIAALTDKNVYIPYLKDMGAAPFKGFDIPHENPAFKEYSDAFQNNPTGYQPDQFCPPSVITDITNIFLKIASGKKFDPKDLDIAQTNLEKDKGLVEVPQ